MMPAFRPERLLCTVLQLLLLIGAPLTARAGMTAEQQPANTQACVILLHGLWRSSLSMKWLEWELEDAGYHVVNRSYPSSDHPVQALASIAVRDGLSGCEEQGAEQVHFVTHSLGGILVREYLSHQDIVGLRRVVMLGPPNQGSQMADYAMTAEILQPFLPPAVAQLGSSAQSVPLRLGRVDFELGVIAGTVDRRSFLPGALEVPSDGTVAVAETIVPGMTDFIELPVTHTFMMQDETVIEQTLYFLANGVFKRYSPPFNAP